MKKLGTLLLTGLLSFSIGTGVFAQELTKDSEENTDINYVVSGTREAKIRDIVITEADAGVFKKNKKIYLRADHLQFEKGTTVEITKGDIKLKDIEEDGDTLILTIDKESSEASVITLKNVKLFLNDTLPEGTYSLDLVTEESKEYSNNVFGANYGDDNEKGKFPTKSVELISDFAVIAAHANQVIPNKELVIAAEEKTVYFNNKPLKISQSPYISEKGYLMIPIRAINEIFNDKISVTWDENTKTATLFFSTKNKIVSMTVGSNRMIWNGVSSTMIGEPEIKNDSVFLPMRDIGYILGANDNNIVWDAENQTATFEVHI